MSNWFYYRDKEKLGPVSPAQLRQLALGGRITPDTVIENDAGKRAYAKNVNGLKFTIAPPPPLLVESLSLESVSSEDESASATQPAPQAIPQKTMDNRAAYGVIAAVGFAMLLFISVTIAIFYTSSGDTAQSSHGLTQTHINEAAVSKNNEKPMGNSGQVNDPKKNQPEQILSPEEERIANLTPREREMLFIIYTMRDFGIRCQQTYSKSKNTAEILGKITKFQRELKTLQYHAQVKKYDDSLLQIMNEMRGILDNGIRVFQELNQMENLDYQAELRHRMMRTAEQSGSMGGNMGKAMGGNDADAVGMAMLFGMIGGALSEEEHKKAIAQEVQQRIAQLGLELQSFSTQASDRMLILMEKMADTYGWERAMVSDILVDTTDETQIEKTNEYQLRLNPYESATAVALQKILREFSEKEDTDILKKCLAMVPPGTAFNSCRERVKEILAFRPEPRNELTPPPVTK